ncbi:hypothetical protein JQX13_38225 [Archangium violaceum]|uniref:hypothetical protein n=1 Tax=Archangium violaceum TaxID=83451 RepID=UPI00193B90AF|nr:hypothetical protein [Archangium violaceum]QRK05931.1 hypothetical protein JQX13_38225 [Archangium violaceum]
MSAERQGLSRFQAAVASLVMVSFTLTVGCGPVPVNEWGDPVDADGAESQVSMLTASTVTPDGQVRVEQLSMEELVRAAREAVGDEGFQPDTVLRSPVTDAGEVRIQSEGQSLRSETAGDALQVSWDVDRGQMTFHSDAGTTTVTLSGTTHRKTLATVLGAIATLTFIGFDGAGEGEVSEQGGPIIIFIIFATVAACLADRHHCSSVAKKRCGKRGVKSIKSSCGGLPVKLRCEIRCRG